MPSWTQLWPKSHASLSPTIASPAASSVSGAGASARGPITRSEPTKRPASSGSPARRMRTANAARITSAPSQTIAARTWASTNQL